MTLREVLIKRGVKALLYRPLSVVVQIVGLALITGTWKWTLPLVGVDIIITGLYYGYDLGWEKWVTGAMKKTTAITFLVKRGVKAVIYRPMSIFVQIVGIGLLTGEWSFVLPLLSIDVVVFCLYYVYDMGWEKWIQPYAFRVPKLESDRTQNDIPPIIS